MQEMNESITSDTSDQSSDPNLNSTNTGGLKNLSKDPLQISPPPLFTKSTFIFQCKKYLTTYVFTYIYLPVFVVIHLLIEEHIILNLLSTEIC